MTIGAECPHGLSAAWCSICKEKDRGQVRNETAWERFTEQPSSSASRATLPRGPRTTAKYDGLCPACGNEVVAGEDMLFLRPREGGDWICEDCTRKFDQAQRQHPTHRS